MNRTTLSALFLALLLGGVAVLPVLAQDEIDDAGWLEECRDQDSRRAVACDVRVESMAATGSLRVDPDENGGVLFRAWDRNVVEVHARVTARADDDAEARRLVQGVSLDLRPGEVRAEVPRRGNVSVTMVIRVPRRGDLSAEAVNGPVGAKGVEGRVDLRTRNGPVSLVDLAGQVTARSQNGPIHVILAGTRWNGPGLDAETRNGPVTVEIPDGYSAEFETGTRNGPFHSDVALTLPPGSYGRDPLRVRLGSGGSPVRVKTTNGPVSIESR